MTNFKDLYHGVSALVRHATTINTFHSSENVMHRDSALRSIWSRPFWTANQLFSEQRRECHGNILWSELLHIRIGRTPVSIWRTDESNTSANRMSCLLSSHNGNWLTDWLTDWLNDWLDWLTGWMDGRLADWPANWLSEWMTGWLAGWLADTDRQTGWLAGWESSLRNTHSASQIPCLLLNPRVHYRVHKSSQIPKPYIIFRKKPFFLPRAVISPPPNPQAGGPTLVGCPWMLTRSYPPYLEAVSSISNPRTRHAVVTGTHITWWAVYIKIIPTISLNYVNTSNQASLKMLMIITIIIIISRGWDGRDM
jgi:hypothetical protein